MFPRNLSLNRNLLARIIHDGSSSPSLTLPHSMGEGGVGGRDRRAEPGGREASLNRMLTDRPSGEPACLDAAANPRLQQKRSSRMRAKTSSVCLVYLVSLVCFVYLVDLVHLVSFVQPQNQTNQMN